MRIARSALGGILLTCLLLVSAAAAQAEDYTNDGTIASYSGTTSDDNFTNNGTVTGDVDMTQGGQDTFTNSATGVVSGKVYLIGNGATVTNSGTLSGYLYGNYRGEGDVSIYNSSSGAAYVIYAIYEATGDAEVVNDGQVLGILGVVGAGGDAVIINNGSVSNDIYGQSRGTGSSYIVNNGSVATSIYGSLNTVADMVGGGNTIYNYGTVGSGSYGKIYGSRNRAAGASGGNNTIYNYGSVNLSIYGSDNNDTDTSGGGNTIYNSGTVKSDIYGSYNYGSGSSGGGNAIYNYDTVGGSLYGSYNNASGTSGGGNAIYNSGSVTGGIYGSYNKASGTSGGGNTIYNSGTVGGDIYGTYYVNADPPDQGDGNAVYNSGSVTGSIYCNYYNTGDAVVVNSGTVGGVIIGARYGTGDVYITNSGTADSLAGNLRGMGDVVITNSGTVTKILYGSYSGTGDVVITNSGTVGISIYGLFSSAVGDVTIYNSGTVDGYISGNITSTGDVTIYNSGTVDGYIQGSYLGTGDVLINNSGQAYTLTGVWGGTGDVTIYNSGTVEGNVYGVHGGTGNAVIYNSGAVGGSIYAGDGDDTVYILSGSSVAGSVDGQDGTDTLYYCASGVTDSTAFSAKYLNFENLGLYVDGDTTLSGDWTFNLGSTVVSGGSLVLASGGTLSGTSLDNAGTATFNGAATFIGGVTNTGSLGVGSGGTISGTSLDNAGTAAINGAATFSGGVTNTGSLGVGAGGSLRAASLISQGEVDVAGRLSAGVVRNYGAMAVSGTLASGFTQNSGTLNLNGALFGDVDNQGLLSGSGDLFGDVTNGGAISPGNSVGTLNIYGDLTLESGSTLLIELAGDGSSDLVDVSGAVTINGGALSASIARALYTDGFSWKILSAGDGISGAFDAYDDPTGTEVLSLGLESDGDSLSLVISRKSYGDFASGGAADTGRGLDGLVSSSTGAMAELLVAMDFDMDAEQISQVLGALNPEMYTAFSAAALYTGRLFDQALAQRVDGVGRQWGLGGEAPSFAAKTAEGDRGWAFWARALGYWGTQEAMDGYLGYGQSTGGAALGADYALGDWLIVGLATGATRTDLSWDHSGYAGDTDAVHTGLYARVNSGPAFARLSASFARLTSSAERGIAFENIAATARADFDADLYAAGLAVGYQAHAGAWLLEPLAALDGQWLREKGFAEGGAGFLSMNIAERDTDSLLFNLGFSASRLVRADEWEIVPKLGLAWQHQMGDDQPSLDASFSGYGEAPFRVQGAKYVRDAAVVEAGLNMVLSQRLDLFALYSLTVADDYQAQALNAGFRYDF